MNSASLALLVDHDNIPHTQVPFRAVLSLWLRELNLSDLPYTSDLTVRVFGGWYRERSTTERRFQAASYYQATCPSVLRLSGRVLRISFQFADTLSVSTADGVQPSITHTVVRRQGAAFHTQSRTWEDCNEDDCELAKVRRWFWRRTACTKRSCRHSFSKVFERDEQKQVDVHLVVELLLLCGRPTPPREIGVVSSDWDMLPGLLAAAHLVADKDVRLSTLRFSPTETYQDQVLRDLGVRIINDESTTS